MTTAQTKNNVAQILSFFDFSRKKNILPDFFNFDIARFEQMLREEGENFWRALGERRALAIFHAAGERVPAYADFLRRHKIMHKKIKTIEDFSHVPLTDKENYIQKYPLSMRSWDGEISNQSIIAMSSGTSGEATAWPRGGYQEGEAAVIHELIYRYSFDMDKHATLLIIGFPMGIYVSGIATLLPSFLVAAKGYRATIASAGNNKAEFLRAVKNLQKDFEQIVLVGHPLFIKDVIESGAQSGIAWQKKPVRMMFCSEEFSEKWRRYVMGEAGVSPGLKTVVSTYGSSELLLAAWETPLSIALRNFMEQDENFRNGLLGSEPVCNFFQYNPLLRYIESDNNELVFTSASGIPLVRFNIHDSGRPVTYKKTMDSFSKLGDLPGKKFPELDASLFWQMPFVALWGRNDHKIIFYAANIYPEHIRRALSQSALFPKLTGKFTMRKEYLKNMDEFLEINVELRKDVRPSRQLASKIRDYVAEHLKKMNMEYRDASSHLDKDLRPRVKLWPCQHEKYFKPGLKPRYIAND